MSDDSPHPPQESDTEHWSALSSLVDGEAAPELQEHCLVLWADNAEARERWRHYQLIGDVLRSRELARDEVHDAAFLSALRSRLAREPAVLRPVQTRLVQRLRAWAAPMAATAGVAAVAGVVVMLRTTPTAGDSALAAARPSAQPVMVSAPGVVQAMQPVNGRLIRDARLDRYFAAHRQSATGAALQMPGGTVRSVDTIVLEDR
ncbi:MAG TPA: sigma-E factor negative regulatory protein [Burkholderiaceae bacterium]|nr:sigma-E factor negative regulatory protein [Burkholderiaceae bacterium]